MSVGPPLSPSRTYGGLIFVSGQIGVDADRNIPPDLGRQIELAMRSLGSELDAAGGSFGSVLKTTVFITRDQDFDQMNEIYRSFLGEPWPARTTLVSRLALPQLLFEIDAIATVE